MALETFGWSPRKGPTGDIKFTTRSAQYGDGYVQVTGDGINSENQSWPLTFVGVNSDIKPILKFVRDHGETRAFKWINPLGELGLYRATQIKPTVLDFARMSLAVTFVTAYRAEEL